MIRMGEASSPAGIMVCPVGARFNGYGLRNVPAQIDKNGVPEESFR